MIQLLPGCRTEARNHDIDRVHTAIAVHAAGHSHAPPDACNEAGAHCLAQRVVGAEALGAKLSPIKTEPGSSHFAALRDASDAGGAASGHSDTTYQALLPTSATAAAAEGHAGALLAQREPASPDSVVTAPKPVAAAGTPASALVVEVPDLVPLTPPDASEGPEAAAEYEMYLQRWDAGDTLAQRWHRCEICRGIVSLSVSVLVPTFQLAISRHGHGPSPGRCT